MLRPLLGRRALVGSRSRSQSQSQSRSQSRCIESELEAQGRPCASDTDVRVRVRVKVGVGVRVRLTESGPTTGIACVEHSLRRGAGLHGTCVRGVFDVWD
eukprot:77024-Chlamydomonas_euryale.AAC.1